MLSRVSATERLGRQGGIYHRKSEWYTIEVIMKFEGVENVLGLTPGLGAREANLTDNPNG